MKKALYLPGGGARGAYQVGALMAINEIIQQTTDELIQIPWNILSSTSVGAINAAYLAMHADNFGLAVNNLTQLWSTLKCDNIYRASNLSLMKSMMRNLISMSMHINLSGGGYLLDTSPLKKMIENGLDFDKINGNIEKGLLSDFEIATTCYDLHGTVSFYKSTQPQPAWRRIRHISNQANITSNHILASAALPLFFPTVKINKLHYGDGSIRLNAPLRAATRLGAKAILIISNRHVPKPLSLTPIKEIGDISFGNVLGNMLNALFLDNIDRDLEQLNKINDSLKLIPNENHINSKWGHIKTLHLYPSTDLGEIARASVARMPRLLRYLMSAFGAKAQSGDLISFLLFDAGFCKKLIDIGYHDTMLHKSKIKEFFEI